MRFRAPFYRALVLAWTGIEFEKYFGVYYNIEGYDHIMKDFKFIKKLNKYVKRRENEFYVVQNKKYD